MLYPGGATDEYGVQAKALNQSFIGQDFGLIQGGHVLYGKIGAIKVYETHVMLTLAGVEAEDIRLQSEQELFFSHGQHENQVMIYLNEFSEYLRKKTL